MTDVGHCQNAPLPEPVSPLWAACCLSLALQQMSVHSCRGSSMLLHVSQPLSQPGASCPGTELLQTCRHMTFLLCLRMYGAVLNNNLYLKETANFTVQADWVPLLAPLCPFNCSFRGRCISTGNCACDPGGFQV